MYVVNTSIRALIIALTPLAAAHVVLFAMVLLKTQTTPVLLDLPSPDKVLILYAVQLTMDGALMFVGHLVLRDRAVSSRFAYALMGGAMAASSHVIALRNGWLLSPPDPGSEITAGLLPTFAGMMAGFLYGQFAGLAPAARWPKFSDEALNASRTFEGPVRVRTSVAAVAIAAVIPAALTAILSLTFFSLVLPTDFAPEPSAAPIFLAALPAQIFITALVATIIPSAILVICTHHLARALRRSRGYEYAALGGLMTALCGLIIAPFSPLSSVAFLFGLAVIYGAIMGALYRRFAGIEPVPLPEPVLVIDENTLVPADHPSRQSHSVVFTD
jgi:hypothetical protein